MSKTKFRPTYTKAPWRIDGNVIVSVADPGGDWPVIAKKDPTSILSAEEQAVNFNLLAAAPDLLEACVAAFHLITDGEKESEGHGWSKDKTLARLKKAVAKAEGYKI